MLQKQKMDAKKYMSRQQLRLLSQAEVVQQEKNCIADLLENNIVEFENLNKLLST
jgi:hypothetical protein